MRQTAIGGALAAAFLQSCTLGPTVSASAVDYNRAIANSANQILLLNILRARDGTARYHTYITKVQGNISVASTTGLTTTFGRNPNMPFGLNWTVVAKTGPVFDTTAQDHAKFWAKLTAPVSMAVIDRLWQEGWRKELLLLLFVEKIEKVPPKPAEGKIAPAPEIWINSARDRTIRDEFLNKLRELRLRIGRKPTETDVAVTSKKNGVEKKWTETRITFEYEFCQTNRPENQRPSSKFECRTGDPEAKQKRGVTSGPDERSILTRESTEQFKPAQKTPPKTGRAPGVAGKKKNDKPDIYFHIRSVEGVIHYLGEILRAHEDGRPPVTFCSDYLDPIGGGARSVCSPRRLNILFAVARGALGQSSLGLVSVPYRGDLYRTVTKVNGFPGRVRTNQVLSLLHQLQALLRDEPTAVPVAQPVRVVN